MADFFLLQQRYIFPLFLSSTDMHGAYIILRMALCIQSKMGLYCSVPAQHRVSQGGSEATTTFKALSHMREKHIRLPTGRP